MEKQRGIVFLDIETSPNLAYVWGMWEQNVIEFKSQWYIMSFSAKWLGGGHTTKGLVDYRGYTKGSEDDKALIKELWYILDKAEIVIAQNGDQFDIKKINARFAYHNLPPPSPYRTVDTKKVAKKYFAFNSNSLDNLGEYLGLGRKIKHDGFELWQGCMTGDKKSWKQMKAYNKQDVVLLEKIYLHLLPWIKNHPNLGLYTDKMVCPKCKSVKLERRGVQYNQTTKYVRLFCQDCRGWSRSTNNLQEVRPLVSI